MHRFKKIISTVVACLLGINSLCIPVFAAEVNTNTSLKGYHFIEDKPSEYGYINAQWVDDDGNIANFQNNESKINSIEPGLVKGSSLPSYYLSESISSIKNQGYYGCCWAFGSINSCESYAIKQGFETKDNVDFSESHLVQSTYTLPSSESDTRYNDGYTLSQSNIFNYGGNWQRAASTLADWSGIVNESTFPFYSISSTNSSVGYNEFGQGFYLSSVNVPGLSENTRYLREKYIIKNAVSLSTRDDIKEWVYNKGNCTISFYYDSSYLLNSQYYYYPTVTAPNHMVSIVGWSDDIEISNFVKSGSSNCPSEKGAWLCKNSYGPNWGNNGYFWLSYCDKSIDAGSIAGFEVQSSDNFDINHSYNGTYPTFICGFSNNKNSQYANSFNTNGKETIKAITTYTFLNNQELEIMIYSNPSAQSFPTSGTLLKKWTTTVERAGYNQIDVPNSLSLNGVSRYSVIIRPIGSTVYIPLECNTDNSDFNVSLSSKYDSFLLVSGSSWKVTSYFDDGNGHNVANAHIGVLTKCEHKYNYVVTKKPTYKFTGEELGTCEYCNKQITREIPVRVCTHSCSFVTTKYPTCTEPGTKEGVCQTCGNTIIETIPASGHNLSYFAPVQCTCTHDGSIAYYYCSECHKSYEDFACTKELSDTSVPAKGHKMVFVLPKDSTCTKKGNIAYYHCTECNKNFSDVLGATVLTDVSTPVSDTHILSFVEEIPVGCLGDGVKAHYFCPECQNNFEYKNGAFVLAEDLIIPKLEHQITFVSGIPATTTQTGLMRHYHCERCGNNYADRGGEHPIDNIVIPKIEEKITYNICMIYISSASKERIHNVSELPPFYDLKEVPAGLAVTGYFYIDQDGKQQKCDPGSKIDSQYDTYYTILTLDKHSPDIIPGLFNFIFYSIIKAFRGF